LRTWLRADWGNSPVRCAIYAPGCGPSGEILQLTAVPHADNRSDWQILGIRRFHGAVCEPTSQTPSTPSTLLLMPAGEHEWHCGSSAEPCGLTGWQQFVRLLRANWAIRAVDLTTILPDLFSRGQTPRRPLRWRRGMFSRRGQCRHRPQLRDLSVAHGGLIVPVHLAILRFV